MDFQALINSQMENYISEKLPEQVSKHLDSMVDNILGEVFGRWGDNSKQIQKVLSEKIKIDLTDLSLIDYNGMIATAIQSHFNQLSQEKSIEPIMKLVGEIVGEKYKKEQITIYQLFDEIKDLVIDSVEYGDEGEISFYAEYNKKYDWVECWADFEEGKSKRECGVRFIFKGPKETKGKGGGTIFSIQFPSYAGVQSTIDLTRFDKVQKLIHNLWTSGVRISIDEDTEDGEIESFDKEFYKEYD